MSLFILKYSFTARVREFKLAPVCMVFGIILLTQIITYFYIFTKTFLVKQKTTPNLFQRREH